MVDCRIGLTVANYRQLECQLITHSLKDNHVQKSTSLSIAPLILLEMPGNPLIMFLPNLLKLFLHWVIEQESLRDLQVQIIWVLTLRIHWGNHSIPWVTIRKRVSFSAHWTWKSVIMALMVGLEARYWLVTAQSPSTPAVSKTIQ